MTSMDFRCCHGLSFDIAHNITCLRRYAILFRKNCTVARHKLVIYGNSIWCVIRNLLNSNLQSFAAMSTRHPGFNLRCKVMKKTRSPLKCKCYILIENRFANECNYSEMQPQRALEMRVCQSKKTTITRSILIPAAQYCDACFSFWKGHFNLIFIPQRIFCAKIQSRLSYANFHSKRVVRAIADDRRGMTAQKMVEQKWKYYSISTIACQFTLWFGLSV